MVPDMKYMGSKARVAKEIASIIDYKNYDYYIEPFCGGCNFIDKIDHPRRILGLG
jgi:DNA adenine methylase